MTTLSSEDEHALSLGPESFAEGRGGLFSPRDLWRLLAAELDRARRQKYATGCLRVGIDRLDSLADIYGREARVEISANLLAFLERGLRDSDFLAPLSDGGALIVLPHIGLDGLRAVSQRTLSGARKLEFRSGRKTVHVTLSAGLAHWDGSESDLLDGLVRGATSSLTRAVRNGGDRALEWDALAELDQAASEVRRRESALDEARTVARTVVRETAAEAEKTGGMQVDPSLLLGAVRQALGEHAEALKSARQPTKPADDGRTVDHLERRVAKLARELEGYQGQLLKLLDEDAPADGIRSIGRLPNPDSQSGTQKHEMMSDIFSANLALHDALSKPRRGDRPAADS